MITEPDFHIESTSPNRVSLNQNKVRVSAIQNLVYTIKLVETVDE